MSTGHDHNAHAAHSTTPGGVLVADAGLRLVLGTTIASAGRHSLEFTVVDGDGTPVTDYVEQHDKDLHLIAVRRDLAGFQHVHPVRDAAGVWRTDVDLTAGVWRILADFTAASIGRGVTLGADLFVAGEFTPEPLPAVSSAVTADGYTVILDGGLTPQEGRTLTFRVERDGAPVTDLEPYLAAYGHLVALRSGDLAYLHVHPDGAPGDGVTEPGPAITFHATAPSAGDYRLFLDFKHNGTVRTAEFTVSAETPPHHGHHHHH
ncbi:hypothetical protein SAMN04488550_3346 [Gordonia malaquae]|uniref:Secreted protein n=1 Tax=Gordonia malaquae NBRC 108250 TaxID=1223542 RepID=M3V9I0_GORML|nr:MULTISPECIES: hypothetical protein [Gordonia]QRY61326.1 hypothetical protein JVX90_12930 [Gordonia sp. PDNC005]GAC77958.1 hypothetical protein GM1_001_00830 [Gordonia malaquae NBRC 108250]SED86524.1 hypothetical protein SAMN04488550_3346 [Gordonia malaquae]